MSNYTAETHARCPKCGGALTERTGRSMGEVVYMYDCDHCDWDDEYARADRLTVATAPWSRDLWAEVERLTVERDALRAAAADREHPLHFAMRMADAYYRETGRGASELDAANLAWLEAGCPLEVEITAEDMARLTAERDAAAAKERAAVVAWLAESSGRIESMRNEFGPPTYSEVCQYVADAIEAGDHLDVTRG